ncbi:hypothetical protein C1752_00835 [Acaryochloris thomasi RCC1774]|uniref:Uncharacterized protein n=1 Tax=Acaryochloris thomasi RCC1774 TaxID=1764569 RepID=A0A2W1JMY9_9CYAN|nr:hypothetical protein [Acaryochloris thomasi]PZD74693.1 hypothetical protein C1752_00835 [Acaryochloris thomasi RCC1774]
MGANIHQLQQSLEALEAQAAQLVHHFSSLYQDYLRELGASVSKQLMRAAYHLCTQTEPQAFVGLSLSQQQSLQQGLQRLGWQLQQSLLQTLRDTLVADAQRMVPEHLVLAIHSIEDTIVAVLQQTSRDANYLLQDHQILEIQSMDALFKIAAQADEAGRPITSPPHLLKALVEAKESELEEDNVPVVAIYLQITDIELADSELMAWRHQLRQATQQLMALNKDFVQKQKARTTAEAEAAWRASWFPYSPEKTPTISDENECVESDDKEEGREP